MASAAWYMAMETSTLATGKMISQKAKVRTSTWTEHLMKVIGLLTSIMVQAKSHGATVPFMKANMKMERNTVRVDSPGKMVAPLRASSIAIEWKAMEPTFGQMNESTQANGKTT